MTRESMFRIYSMTKPLVSLGIMQLVEDGHLLLNDPLAKYIPGVRRRSASASSARASSTTPCPRGRSRFRICCATPRACPTRSPAQGMVQRMYAKAGAARPQASPTRSMPSMVAKLPLMCQPGAEWKYSRATDILGRVIEVISGKTLGCLSHRTHLRRCRWPRRPSRPRPENKHRLAQPFPVDPWTGDKVALFDHAGKARDGIRRRRARLDNDGLRTVLPDAAKAANSTAHASSAARRLRYGVRPS